MVVKTTNFLEEQILSRSTQKFLIFVRIIFQTRIFARIKEIYVKRNNV